MADISKIRLGNQGGTYTEYNIKDATARQATDDLDERVDEIEDGTYTKTEVDNKLASYAKKDGGVALASSAEKLLGDPKAVEFGGQGMPTTTDGMALIKEVRGRSIIWNQLVENGDFAEDRLPQTFSLMNSTTASVGVSGGAMTMQVTSNNIEAKGVQSIDASFLVVGHKYLALADIDATQSANFAFIGWKQQNGTTDGDRTNVEAGTRGTATCFYTQSNAVRVGVWVPNATPSGSTIVVRNFNIYDLTKIFGAGNEPATVEEFQALYNRPYYDYNAGEIMSNKTQYLNIYTGSDMERFDLNLTTLKGKLNASGQSVTIFPNGMRSAGSVYDALVADGDGYARRAIVRTGIRAYESGDDTNPAVVTDGESTIYALATPQIYVLDAPILFTLRTYNGGSIIQNPATPYDTAPMAMEVALPLDMPENYIGEDSMDDFLAALGTAMGGTWSKTYNTSTGKWEFNFASN